MTAACPLLPAGCDAWLPHYARCFSTTEMLNSTASSRAGFEECYATAIAIASRFKLHLIPILVVRKIGSLETDLVPHVAKRQLFLDCTPSITQTRLMS